MGLVWAAEAAAGAGDGGGYWQLALVLAAIGFLGLFARWRKARQPAVHTAREFRDRDDDPNRYRDAADKAIVELLETSRVLNAQVDTKIRVLNRLVREAEENCARLESLLARAAGELERPARAAAGRDGAAEASREAAPPPAEDAPPEGPKFLSELHERVHRLKTEGGTVAEIAKATNLSTSEVEFIIGTF